MRKVGTLNNELVFMKEDVIGAGKKQHKTFYPHHRSSVFSNFTLLLDNGSILIYHMSIGWITSTVLHGQHIIILDVDTESHPF
uniref:Uncharacterized protein n=1 Tax=Nelumbo nucifera TaxID=4432 RepID=A0A822YHW3_NELNU|nr:TPA_asm: hypothetical protein HUJ06_009426 [Nelumbo nucifera]